MPGSRKRKTQRHGHIDYIPHEKKKKSAVPVAIIFCTLAALGIAWFASGSYIGLAAGLIAGIVIGYFTGKQMDRTFNNKK